MNHGRRDGSWRPDRCELLIARGTEPAAQPDDAAVTTRAEGRRPSRVPGPWLADQDPRGAIVEHRGGPIGLPIGQGGTRGGDGSAADLSSTVISIDGTPGPTMWGIGGRLPPLVAVQRLSGAELGGRNDSRECCGGRGGVGAMGTVASALPREEVIHVSGCNPGYIGFETSQGLLCIEPMLPPSHDPGPLGGRPVIQGLRAAEAGGRRPRPPTRKETCEVAAAEWRRDCAQQSKIFSSACFQSSYEAAIALCTGGDAHSATEGPRMGCTDPLMDVLYDE
jgi:hypothetical protein